jgi:hypothetical protein
MRRLLENVPRYLTQLLFLVAICGLAFGQDEPSDVPENAQAKSYGGGWNCDPG